MFSDPHYRENTWESGPGVGQCYWLEALGISVLTVAVISTHSWALHPRNPDWNCVPASLNDCHQAIRISRLWLSKYVFIAWYKYFDSSLCAAIMFCITRNQQVQPKGNGLLEEPFSVCMTWLSWMYYRCHDYSHSITGCYGWHIPPKWKQTNK